MLELQRHCGVKTVINFFAVILAVVATNHASAQIMDTPAEATQKRISQQLSKAKPKPYEISSRVHLGQGTNSGYLVVEVQLGPGKHIYSLTQAGNVPPTTLKVSPNKTFQITGAFSPDKPATVIENHPDFGQRVEKHTGKIQFFAPITVDPTADVTKLAAEIQFDGQVCSKTACVPIRAKKLTGKLTGKFAGYFESTPEPAPASVAQQPQAPQPSSPGIQLK